MIHVLVLIGKGIHVNANTLRITDLVELKNVNPWRSFKSNNGKPT